jgi:hypothetical protein
MLPLRVLNEAEREGVIVIVALVVFAACLAVLVGIVLSFDRPPATKRAARQRNGMAIFASMLIVVGCIVLAYIQATS